MKPNSAVGITIALNSVILGFLLLIIVADVMEWGYWVFSPYLLFIGFLTLGLVTLSIGLAGFISKTKHKNGFNIMLVTGIITTLATFLVYYLWW